MQRLIHSWETADGNYFHMTYEIATFKFGCTIDQHLIYPNFKAMHNQFQRYNDICISKLKETFWAWWNTDSSLSTTECITSVGAEKNYVLICHSWYFKR